MAEVRKEVALVKGEAVEASCEATAVREMAKVAKDMATTVANDAKDIGL